MKGSVQMNAWFRFSRFMFKVLVLTTLFLIGAWVGTSVAANWQLFAIVAIVATILIIAVWFVGNFSAGAPQEDDDE